MLKEELGAVDTAVAENLGHQAIQGVDQQEECLAGFWDSVAEGGPGV